MEKRDSKVIICKYQAMKDACEKESIRSIRKGYIFKKHWI